jgi:ribosomal protein S18 acetylase RimI-like enzyme
LHLLFAHRDTELRTRTAQLLLTAGDLDPAGLWVQRGTGGIEAVFLVQTRATGRALVWPPVARPGIDIAPLADVVFAQLRAARVRIVQAIITHSDPGRATLTALGIPPLTQVVTLFQPVQYDVTPHRLHFTQAYNGEEALPFFADTLVGTRDFAELGGVRTPEETWADFELAPEYDRHGVWLAWQGMQPAGVLVVHPDETALVVAYLGLVPSMRGRRLGADLVLQAHVLAQQRGQTELLLDVDARNEPAWALYRRSGWVEYDRQEVHLAIWPEQGP